MKFFIHYNDWKTKIADVRKCRSSYSSQECYFQLVYERSGSDRAYSTPERRIFPVKIVVLQVFIQHLFSRLKYIKYLFY